MLSGVNRGSPWALDHAEGASNLLESALGSYTSAFLLDWRVPGGFDAGSAALHVAREPDVWTDGSMVEDKVSPVSSSGAGFSSGRAGRFWAERSWGHIDDDVQGDRTVASCRGYCSIPGPLQSVQRAELWGVILALQASCGAHLGVDNLNLVRHVGRLLDGGPSARPFEIVQDGDLLCLIDRMLQLRGLGTVKVTKVKGHADDGMVLHGRVRDLDRLGNNAADGAADFGRRRVPVHVIDARRNLVGVCNRWYPVVRHLHLFFLLLLLGLLLIMMMAVVLRRTLLFGLLVLCLKGRELLMLFVTLLFYLVLSVFGMGIGYLLVSVVSLLRMLGFGLILCVFVLKCRPFWALIIGRLMLLSLVLGVFHLLRCSFCMSSGLVNDFFLRVLFLGIGGLDVQFQCRLFLLVQALIFGAPVGFWGPSFVLYVCCLVALVGFSLGILALIMVVFDTLVGKSAVMVLRPDHVKLLLFCFWMSFSFFLGYYSAASRADLLAGTLPLRYFFESFARKIPTWRLPESGSVASLLASGELVWGGPSALSAALGGAGVCLARGSGGGVERVRLHRKTPAHLARQGISEVQFRPRVWKRLRDPQDSASRLSGAKFLRVHQEAGGHDPGFARAGIG